MAVLGKGLAICPASDTACKDHFTVTIKTVNNKNDVGGDANRNSDEGCAQFRACIKPESEGDDPHPELDLGQHMGDMYLIFEDPPFRSKKDNMGVWQHTEYVWTRIDILNEDEVPRSGGKRYIYMSTASRCTSSGIPWGCPTSPSTVPLGLPTWTLS